ncbi:MAG: hypothetical protein DMD80_27905 [Candidatus Rokuibacteriota bacterium]|nr:MAG: hypothetical protein DMD80_27905 [Candidatus Rokubacteria bacterium]PYN28027.1 MAG: hypothetical protein DMD76_06565 [Candidatus Rokubacteria bacterium]
MARQLVIVAREHPDLYSYLRERFAGRAQAEVLLDRRVGQRRGEHVPVPSDRRRQDRRARPGVDTMLRSRSHVIVTLP